MAVASETKKVFTFMYNLLEGATFKSGCELLVALEQFIGVFIPDISQSPSMVWICSWFLLTGEFTPARYCTLIALQGFSLFPSDSAKRLRSLQFDLVL